MKKITLLMTAFVFSLTSFSQAPNWAWAGKIAGDGDEKTPVVVDQSGNAYIAGVFTGTVDFDPGPGTFNMTATANDMFILKLDSSGNFLWAKKTLAIVGNQSTAAKEIILDSDGNTYITGYFQNTVDFDPGTGNFNLTATGSSDIFVLKLDTAGNFIWVRRMGGGNSSVGNGITSIATNIYVTGYFSGTASFGSFNLISAGAQDIFICKLDSGGNFIWANPIGGTGNDVATSMAADTLQNIYITGYFSATVDFDPGVGTYNLTSAAGEDMFFSKFNSSGNFIWAKRVGGNGVYDKSHCLRLDAANNVYTTGQFYGTIDFDPGAGTYNQTAFSGGHDFFILKLDSAGNFIWARRVGSGPSDDIGFALSLDALANIYVTGVYRGTVDFNPSASIFNLTSLSNNGNIFVLKLNSSGGFVWAKGVPGNDYQYGVSCAVTSSGSMYITASFRLTATFDSWVLSATDRNIAIAKLGNIITDIESMEEVINDFFIFPNPTTNELTVQSSEFGEIESIEIYSSLGKRVFSRLETSNQQHVTISVADFTPGIYFITITDQAGNKVTKKVVKM